MSTLPIYGPTNADRVLQELNSHPYRFYRELLEPAYSAALEAVKQKNKALEKAILSNLIQLLKRSWHESLGYLSLCICSKVTLGMRNFIDKTSLELLQPKIQSAHMDADNIYNIVSVGPGACFQETVILTQLAIRVRKVHQVAIRLILIEPSAIDTSLGMLQSYATDVLSRLPASIHIVALKEFAEYLQLAKSDRTYMPDLVLGIDINEISIENDSENVPFKLKSQLMP